MTARLVTDALGPYFDRGEVPGVVVRAWRDSEVSLDAAGVVRVADLLTMRLGYGVMFEGDCPALGVAAGVGLGIGPPDPSVPLTPDAWIARFAELPLLEQSGLWRSDLSYGVLGVGLARAGRRAVEKLLREPLLDPLGMADTTFVAPPGRLPPCSAVDELGLMLLYRAGDRRWAVALSFPDARGGLVSTATDLLRFAVALLSGGGVLTAAAVTATTTDHLTPDQRCAPSAPTFLGGARLGVRRAGALAGVRRVRAAAALRLGRRARHSLVLLSRPAHRRGAAHAGAPTVEGADPRLHIGRRIRPRRPVRTPGVSAPGARGRRLASRNDPVRARRPGHRA